MVDQIRRGFSRSESQKGKKERTLEEEEIERDILLDGTGENAETSGRK